MSSSRLIIDLNRCFEPNAFNTGPPIPSSPQQSTSSASSYFDDAYALLESRHNASTPELTSSPASSIGSSLHSLALEDEEIRKIFANPEFNHTTSATFSGYDNDAAIAREDISVRSRKDELNPLAAPFTPSFARAHCPENIQPIDLTFQLSPLDLGFNPVEFPYPPPHADDYSLHASPFRQCVPLPTVYSPVPLRTFYDSENDNSGLATAIPGPSRCPPPVYTPLFQEAMLPETSDRLCKILASAIVAGSTNWDIDTLLELAELIGEEACRPTQRGVAQDSPLIVCDVSRYAPVEGLHGIDIQQETSEQQTPEGAVADMAKHLHTQLNEMHEELGQMFAWNLRETILTRFIHCWDCAKPASINYQNRPHAHYVRSALALCKSIAALFTRGLIMKEHISMCISILMKDLMSVEHFEALANIVLGCGAEFWGPAPGDLIATVDVEVAPGGVMHMNDGSLLLSTNRERATVRVVQSDHVTYFLSGLVANVVGRNLQGDESVVDQGWGQGQLPARIREVVDSVKLWESVVMNLSAIPVSR